MQAFGAYSFFFGYGVVMKNFIVPISIFITASTSCFAMVEDDTAAHPTHVVELFTSQGCSSCPPANRFVTKLADDSSTLVLSYGVTYWDYLGWADTFGDAKFTQRQRDYRDAFDASNIYTPQIVLGGSAHSPRYSKRDVKDMPLPSDGLELSLKRSGDMLTISAVTPKDVIIDIISFTPGEQSVDVKRGENGGKNLKLTNVVKAVQTVDWNGQSASLSLPREDETQYAVLVHDKISAKILDAAVIK
jgi:hypothetical protein